MPSLLFLSEALQQKSIPSFQLLLLWSCFQETGFSRWSEIRNSLGGVWACLLWFHRTWLARLRTWLLGLETIFSY